MLRILAPSFGCAIAIPTIQLLDIWIDAPGDMQVTQVGVGAMPPGCSAIVCVTGAPVPGSARQRGLRHFSLKRARGLAALV